MNPEGDGIFVLIAGVAAVIDESTAIQNHLDAGLNNFTPSPNTHSTVRRSCDLRYRPGRGIPRSVFKARYLRSPGQGRSLYQSILYSHNPSGLENVTGYSLTSFDELFVLIGEEIAKSFDVRNTSILKITMTSTCLVRDLFPMTSCSSCFSSSCEPKLKEE